MTLRPLILAAALAASIAPAWGDWNPGELVSGRLPDPSLHQWFYSLHSADTTWCCDESDGQPATEWSTDGDHYTATFSGVTLPVPTGALIPGANRMGEALVWGYPRPPATPTKILCFLPGPMD